MAKATRTNTAAQWRKLTGRVKTSKSAAGPREEEALFIKEQYRGRGRGRRRGRRREEEEEEEEEEEDEDLVESYITNGTHPPAPPDR